MAKRKKSTKRTTRRRTGRRGIGALNIQSSLMDTAGILAGAAMAGYANKLLLSRQSATIQKVAPIALGLLVPTVIKSNLGKNIGHGMIAYGGIKILQGFGLAGDMMDDSETVTIGADDLSVIAGDEFAMAGDDYAMAGDNLSVLAGLEDMDEDN